MEKREPSCIVFTMYIGTSMRENSMEVCLKNSIEVPEDPVIPHLGINPEKAYKLKDMGNL